MKLIDSFCMLLLLSLNTIIDIYFTVFTGLCPYITRSYERTPYSNQVLALLQRPIGYICLPSWLGICINPTGPNLDGEHRFVQYGSVLRSYDTSALLDWFNIFADDITAYIATPTVARSDELNMYSIYLILFIYGYCCSWVLFWLFLTMHWATLILYCLMDIVTE